MGDTTELGFQFGKNRPKTKTREDQSMLDKEDYNLDNLDFGMEEFDPGEDSGDVLAEKPG